MPPKSTLRSVQVLRAIAAILVVVHHQAILEPRYGLGQPLLTGFIGAFGVDIFFVISGFMMFYVGANKPPGLELATRFVVARLTRVAPLYWFYTLLLAGLVFLLPGAFTTPDHISVERTAKSLLFWPQNGALPLIHQGWTLSYEMLFYILFSLSLFLDKRRILILIVAMLCLVLSGTLLHTEQDKALAVATSPLLIEFILGMLIAKLFVSTFIIPYCVALIGGIAGFAILFIISSACHYDSAFFERFLMWGLPTAAVVLAVTQMERSRAFAVPWLTAIGDASYSLYLTHMFVLPCVGKLWTKYGVSSGIVFFGVALTACLLAALASYRWIEVPLIRLATMPLKRQSKWSLKKSIELVPQ